VSGGLLDGLGWLVGIILATVVFLVIVGGIKSISKVTEKIVPFMAVFYCLFAVIVIILNYASSPAAVANIFTGAFSPEGVAGGALGAMIIGFQRAVFSNEAGIGSASIAHSAVQTNEPVTEGYVSLLEPFIDTIVICTITALVWHIKCRTARLCG
jgi:AGCS family alanine or glycine:cation symporter